MAHFLSNEPAFWRINPKALSYTSVFAEAVDHRIAGFVLGDENDFEAPLALFMRLPAGWVLSRHAHDCYRFEVVIEGAMIVDGGHELGVGDVSTSGPGQAYGPHMAGKDGVLTLEIFSRQAGMHPILEEPLPADDRIVALIADLRSGMISPEEAAASPTIARWAEEALAKQPNLREQLRQDRAAGR
jgi:hypothetical protein